MPIIDGYIGDEILNIGMVGVEYIANVLLKLLRKSGIAFQAQTKGE